MTEKNFDDLIKRIGKEIREIIGGEEIVRVEIEISQNKNEEEPCVFYGLKIGGRFLRS